MSNRRKIANPVLALSMLGLVTALLLLLHLVSPPTTGLWMQTFANSLHVPVFGTIALCIFVLAGTIEGFDLRQRAVTAIGATFLLGALSEAAQIPGPRHASIEDLVSDWLGAAGVVLLAMAISRAGSISRPLRGTVAIAGTSLLLIAVAPLIQISAAYIERNIQKPLIVSFDSHFGRRFFLLQHARLRLSRQAETGKNIANIVLLEGAWPGLIMHDVWPDWRAYSSLVIELGLSGDLPLDINIRVHDRLHTKGQQPHNDRFNMEYVLRPGVHTLRVPLARIMNGPANRQMDLSEIEGIVIFCSAGQAGRSFQLASIRLE